MPSYVPPFGPTSAKLIFVGEAPGAEEEQLGIPFVGSSGKLLNAILARVGINRHDCYFTNVVKTRPPSNNFEVFYVDGPKKTSPSPGLSRSISELHTELRGLRPNVIIPLGSEALRAITSKRSVDAWRGSILPNPLGDGKIISTYHPARVLREYSLLPVFTQDLKRVYEEGSTAELNLPEHRLEINPSYQRVVEFLTELLANPRPFSFDIETTKNHVRCLGIADSALHAVCIPFMSFNRSPTNATTIFIGPTGGSQINSHWEEAEEYEILTLLDKLFASEAHLKLAQNFPFDATILGREFGFQVRGLKLDTLVAAHTMYPELPKGLDFLASLYTRVPYYSDYDVSVDDETWRYNCLDCCVTFEIADRLVEDLKKRRVNHAYPTDRAYRSYDFQSSHIQPAMQTMTRVGRRGVRIDLDVRNQLKSQYESEMIPLLAEFQALAGAAVNPASPKQMADLLYVKLALPVQKHPKTKKVTTDEHAIEKLTKKAPQYKQMFDLLLDWKERQKLVSTYLDVPLTQDNRIMCNFNAAGTVNGRCNSSKTYFDIGTNLQNIPVKSDLGRVLRRMFVADEGYTLIKTDLSQAQFRMVVWFGKIRRLIDEYTKNPKFDVHRWMAGLIFKKRAEDVLKKERDLAKGGVYGGSFRMQAATAAKTYKTTVEEAMFILREMHVAVPEIALWWKDVEATLNASRTLINPFGRVRVFHDRLDDSTYRDAYAAICQMTEADLIHRAITILNLILTDCWPVLQVHDEIVLMCKTEALNHNLPIIKRVMEYPLSIPGVPEPLLIPADLAYGQNWLDVTKWNGEQV